MAKKKRHSETEIAAKLNQARALAGEGKSQSEIARALGISIMTLHRWRKAEPRQQAVLPPAILSGNTPPSDQLALIAELRSENARLRRLVTDFLLEKMKLEEQLPGKSNGPPNRKAR